MEAAAAPAAARRPWRLWALVPILLLVGVVALFASTGASLLDLVGRAPPPADEFDVRRVEFKPGEIRIRVTNPQRQELTIASVTVDDAIVPFRLDGPADARPAALEHDRRPVPVGRGRPLHGRDHELERDRDDARRSPAAVETRGASAARLPRLRADRPARRRRPGRARARLAALAAARRRALARRVHGADRRAAHVPRVRRARRGARPPGRAARAASRGPGWSCSASPSSYLGLTFVSQRSRPAAARAERAARGRRAGDARSRSGSACTTSARGSRSARRSRSASSRSGRS